MSAEQNKANVIRGFEEGINQRKLEVFDEIIDERYVNHSMPAPAPGPAGLKMVIQSFINAFPDFRVEIQDVVAEGDKVATRGVWHGTHQGDFNGIPATGKRIAIGYSDIWRAENGKLVDNWVQMDMMGIMQQLGIVPGAGQ